MRAALIGSVVKTRIKLREEKDGKKYDLEKVHTTTDPLTAWAAYEGGNLKMMLGQDSHSRRCHGGHHLCYHCTKGMKFLARYTTWSHPSLS